MAYVSVAQIESLEETIVDLLSIYDLMKKACQDQIAEAKNKYVIVECKAISTNKLLDDAINTETDAQQQLEQANNQLTSKKEILNSAYSSLSACKASKSYDEQGRCIIPDCSSEENAVDFANRKLCNDHIIKINQMAEQDGYYKSTKIFNGSRLPEIPTTDWFNSKNNKEVQLHLGEHLSFEAEPLSITLNNRQLSNLLISGYNEAIHNGLLASILQSLKDQNGIDEIIYFNRRPIVSVDILKYLNNSEKKVFSNHEVSELNLTKIFKELHKSKRIVIIDELDSTKEFHSSIVNFRPVKQDEPPSPQESLKKILEDGPLQGTFVIAFVDNWKRCNSLCKDLLGFFEMRIGFCMNEDDAGSFVSGTIGKFKGIETDNRAIFADRLKNKVNWFRPYIINEENL